MLENSREIINSFIQKKTFDKKGIYHFIQQREPFLMVDKVININIENKEIICEKHINNDEWYLKGHFPNNPIMPGVLMIESMAQASSIIIKAVMNNSVKNDDYYLLTSVNNVKFKEMCKPGETIVIKATIIKIRGNLVLSSCYIKNQDDNIIAESTIGAFKKKLNN